MQTAVRGFFPGQRARQSVTQPHRSQKKMGQVAHFPKVHFQKVEASRTNLVLIP